MRQEKIIAVVCVRLGSARLPGKVLMPILGKPVLGHLLDRLALAKNLDGVVVATSVRPENDAIEAYCAERGTACFRGPEDDVLGRMLGALTSQGATVGVDVFGDCPLIDPAIVDMMIDRFLAEAPVYDFVGNDLTTTWPPGMEVEVFAVDALRDASANCQDPATREHGTLFIRKNADRYRLLDIEAPPEFRFPDLALELDTAEDLSVVQAVIENFSGRADYALAEIIAFMQARPELAESNADVPRRWKEYRVPTQGQSD